MIRPNNYKYVLLECNILRSILPRTLQYPAVCAEAALWNHPATPLLRASIAAFYESVEQQMSEEKVASGQLPKKGHEATGAHSDVQCEKSDAPRKGKGKAAQKKAQKSSSKSNVTPKEASQTAAPSEATSVQTKMLAVEREASESKLEALFDKTLKEVSSDLQKFAVAAGQPVLSSIVPVKIAEDIKVMRSKNGVPQSTTVADDQTSQSDTYYEIPVLQLLALASSGNVNAAKYETFKVVERRIRFQKPDDPKIKYSGSKEHSRHHEQLTPFEPQLLNVEGGIMDQPLQAAYQTGPSHRTGISQENKGFVAGQFNKHNLTGGKELQKGGDWKAQLTAYQQDLIKQSIKARSGGSNKWLMPKAADGGIFSLGSIKGDSQPSLQSRGDGGAMPATEAFKNISQLVQDLHLKKRTTNGHADDIMSMSSTEVSNFTFFDETTSTPLKSSQFSKFFSAKAETQETGAFKTQTFQPTILPEVEKPADKAESTLTTTLDDDAGAKNRQRANQLLQLMLSRKA